MISRSATHAIRALTFMAARAPNGWCLNREIAADLSLPPQYLTKLLRVLAAEGILESQRGRLGGFRLARPAAKITLLEIVDPFDRLSEHRACLLGQETCSDEMSCPLHDQWSRISDSLRRALRGWTLRQLTSKETASGFPRLARTGLESAGRESTGLEKPPRRPSKRGKGSRESTGRERSLRGSSKRGKPGRELPKRGVPGREAASRGASARVTAKPRGASRGSATKKARDR